MRSLLLRSTRNPRDLRASHPSSFTRSLQLDQSGPPSVPPAEASSLGLSSAGRARVPPCGSRKSQSLATLSDAPEASSCRLSLATLSPSSVGLDNASEI